MDALRFTQEDNRNLSEVQRLDFRKWLRENGRIARQKDGVADANDCTAMSCPPGVAPGADLSITRDEATNQIGYAVMAHSSGKEIRFERRTHQCESIPTPFPASLAQWRVTV